MSAVHHDNTELRQYVVNRGAVGESCTLGQRWKTPWGKPVSAINTVRKSQTASHWGPWKFRPSTTYGALQPHTRVQTRVPGQWVGKSCAVPGRHNTVGQMSPGRIQLLLLNTLPVQSHCMQNYLLCNWLVVIVNWKWYWMPWVLANCINDKNHIFKRPTNVCKESFESS